MKYKIEWVVFFKLLGFLSIVIATIVSTILIANIENQISVLNKKIEEFKDSRIMTGFVKIDSGEKFTQRKIDLLESDILTISKSGDNYVDIFRKRAVGITSEMAMQWAYLLSEDQAESEVKKVELAISRIVNNKKLSTIEIFDQVEKIYKQKQAEASERLKQKHIKWHQNIGSLGILESRKYFWHTIFVWFQIIGLILISSAEIAVHRGKMGKTESVE